MRESDIAKPGERVLLLEDFQDGEISLYKLEGGGNWSIEDDTNQPGNKILQIDNNLTDENSYARLLQPVPTAFIIGWKVRFTKDNLDDRQFVTFRWLDSLRFVTQPSQKSVYLYNYISGEGVFDHKVNFSTNIWYPYRVVVYENNADFYFNNQKIGSAENIESSPLLDIMHFTVGDGSDLIQFDDIYVVTSSK